jgi:hypothetical protein
MQQHLQGKSCGSLGRETIFHHQMARIWFILRGDVPVASDAINFPFEKGK